MTRLYLENQHRKNVTFRGKDIVFSMKTLPFGGLYGNIIIKA